MKVVQKRRDSDEKEEGKGIVHGGVFHAAPSPKETLVKQKDNGALVPQSTRGNFLQTWPSLTAMLKQTHMYTCAHTHANIYARTQTCNE